MVHESGQTRRAVCTVSCPAIAERARVWLRLRL